MLGGRLPGGRLDLRCFARPPAAHSQAIVDAKEAHRLFPVWPKPLYRLAQAQLALGQYAAAVGACLKGEGLSKKDSEVGGAVPLGPSIA